MFFSVFLAFSELQNTEEWRMLWDNTAVCFFLVLLARHSTSEKNMVDGSLLRFNEEFQCFGRQLAWDLHCRLAVLGLPLLCTRKFWSCKSSAVFTEAAWPSWEPCNTLRHSELNPFAAWKAGTEVLNWHLHQMLKPVDTLMQRFYHSLSHGAGRQPLLDSLKFVACLYIQR